MSRLSIEISPEEHQRIKALAALKGQSIKDFILNKLFSEGAEQSAMAELEDLLLHRIRQAKNAPPSSKTIQQITDDELEMDKS